MSEENATTKKRQAKEGQKAQLQSQRAKSGDAVSYHERQVADHCLLRAVKNLLGYRRFSSSDFAQVARKLTAIRPDNEDSFRYNEHGDWEM